MSTENTETEVSPEEVVAFLNSGESDAVKFQIEEPAPAEEKKDSPTVAVPGVADDSAKSTSDGLAWSLQTSQLLDVEVNPLERNLFLKAAMNDERVIWNIETPMGTSQLQTLTEFEMSVLEAAINQDMAGGLFTTQFGFTGTSQAYMLYLQLLSTNRTPYKGFLQLDPTKTLAANMDLLRAHHAEQIKQESTAAKAYRVAVLRIFWAKWKICTDNMLSENFWKPRNTDSE